MRCNALAVRAVWLVCHRGVPTDPVRWWVDLVQKVQLSLAVSPSLADPPPASTAPRSASKKRVRRTLDTSAGVLLTGDATIAQLRAVKEAAEAEAAAKKQRVDDRLAKRAEKEKATAEKTAERSAKKAERAAAAAAKAEAKEERKRKRAEAKEAAQADKENVNPNVSAVARAAPKPAGYLCTVVRERGGVVLRMRKSE